MVTNCPTCQLPDGFHQAGRDSKAEHAHDAARAAVPRELLKPYQWQRVDRPRPGEMPVGLCSERGDHVPHVHESLTLGRFWCTADQLTREPGRSERKRLAT